jgi:hypothetical protein
MKSFNIFRLVRALAFTSLGLASAFASAETLQTKQLKEVPGKVLYAGNSFFYYNNSMHGHIREMALEGMKGHKYNGVSVTISGSGLDWHDMASYFRPDGIGRYSFNAKNEVIPFNLVTALFNSTFPIFVPFLFKISYSLVSIKLVIILKV